MAVSLKCNAQTHKPRPKLSRLVLLGVFVVAAAGLIVWWLYARNYESTDDAQIDGHIDLISSRVSGTVTYINAKVENNQNARTGWGVRQNLHSELARHTEMEWTLRSIRTALRPAKRRPVDLRWFELERARPHFIFSKTLMMTGAARRVLIALSQFSSVARDPSTTLGRKVGFS